MVLINAPAVQWRGEKETSMKLSQSLAAALMVAALGILGAPSAQAQDGMTKTSVVVGQSICLTGPGASLATAFHTGAKLYFDRINAAGGVNGRKIELVTLDDHANAKLAGENTKKLLDQGVFALFGYYGSPQVTAVYPMIKDSDILMFAPMAAADEFRGAMYPNVYSIRPGYAEEAAAIARHAETLGAAKKLAIMHANDSESTAALDSAMRTMTSMGANVVANASFQSGAVTGAVDKVMVANPQSVLVIGVANGAAGAIRDLRAKGFRGPIYGFSNTGESLLAEELGRDGAGVVVVRVVPKSDTAKVSVVRELMQDAQAAKIPKTNVYMLEGYIAARTFAEALKRAGKDPTRAKFRKAIGTLDDVSLGGFRVHFTEDRTGSKLVELSLIDSQGKVRE
jgi:ABC-type branched-subunit amino acid transport system substrate-binding protein